MFYDLHIHSALSPCSDDDMTVNNIVNMAYIKQLDFIAITDHNSVKQLSTLEEVAKNKVDFVYGVEIQSREEIHVLAYFKKNCHLDAVQEFLDMYLIEEPNDEYYFGHQYVFDLCDKVIDEEKRLLIKSLDLSLKEIIEFIHQLGGVAVLAHVLSERFSIMNTFFDIDESLHFDGFEVRNEKEKKIILEQFPFLKEKCCLMNSDAHQLMDISEPLYQLDETAFYNMWRKNNG